MLEWRNPKYNAIGTIDMEVNHPIFGWVPFTANPEDVENHGRELYDVVIEFGEVAERTPPSTSEISAALPDLSAKQFRLGMRALGVTYKMINDAIAAIADEDAREIAQIEWEYSTSYNRLHPFVMRLISTFELSAETVNSVWQEAHLIL